MVRWHVGYIRSVSIVSDDSIGADDDDDDNDDVSTLDILKLKYLCRFHRHL